MRFAATTAALGAGRGRGMNVRAATSADIPELLGLIGSYWQFEGIDGFDPARIAPVLRRLLHEPRLGRIWVAQSDSALVGYLIAVLMMSLEHQGMMAEVDEFFVLPRLRNCGVGAMLLCEAESALAAGGCVRLQLQLGVKNAAARAFYQHRDYADRGGYELLDKPLRAPGNGRG